jgi:hypothetical protein
MNGPSQEHCLVTSQADLVGLAYACSDTVNISGYCKGHSYIVGEFYCPGSDNTNMHSIIVL